jgi:hypothetical protein
VSRFLYPHLDVSISIPRDCVPLTSAGASLVVLIPSAFISLSSGVLSRLPAAGRLRVASAGAYHNILIFAIISFLGWTRFGNRILAIGYEDVSRLGVVVNSIDSVSRPPPVLKRSYGRKSAGLSPARTYRPWRHDCETRRLRFRIKYPPGPVVGIFPRTRRNPGISLNGMVR